MTIEDEMDVAKANRLLHGVALRRDAAFVPLSVREGGSRKKLRWHAKGIRERVALRLAPWLDTAGEWRDIADAWRELGAAGRELQKNGQAMIEEAGRKR